MDKKYTEQIAEMESTQVKMGKFIDMKEKAVSEIEEMKKNYDQKFSKIKNSLFMETAPIKEVFEKARKIVQDMIKDLADPSKDLASSEKAMESLQKIKSSAESKEGSGHDFLEGFEIEEGKNPEESLDEQIKGKIITELLSRVQKSEIGSKSLADFESKLSDLIHKKKIGSMDEEESKKWIIDELGALRKSQTFYGKINKAKAMLLKRIIIKLEGGV